MGFFDFTALAGPVPVGDVPLVPPASLLVTLIGMLGVSALGILTASERSLRALRGLAARTTRVPVRPAARLVLAPLADARRVAGDLRRRGRAR
jgi:hypothetical protein